MKDQYVGILVNHSLYQGIPSGQTKHEELRFYEEAAEAYGLRPIYFRIQDISLRNQLVEGYVKEGAQYCRQTQAIPAVIHNRAIYTRPQPRQRVNQLVQSGKIVFNHCNRYRKLFIHELLMEDESLRNHLPATMKGMAANLQYMMNRYDSIIIKPNNSSIGKGIMKLDKTADGWSACWRVAGSWHTFSFTTLPLWIKRLLAKRDYLVQQRLPLATYANHPFDLRVSVQRGSGGGWQVTGIAARVATHGRFVTNIAQGGEVYALQDVLRGYPHLEPGQVHARVSEFCLAAAHHLAARLPRLADLGFDIGITDDGFPMFVECNGRDLRYCFQKGNMPAAWKASYANPMAYARFLLNG